MRWPWDVLADAIRSLASGDEPTRGPLVARCPECPSTQPAEPIAIIETAVGLADGRKYACLMCSCVFCVGPQGSFKQHRDSLTYIAHDPERKREQRTNNRELQDNEPERVLPPGFKPRPTL